MSGFLFRWEEPMKSEEELVLINSETQKEFVWIGFENSELSVMNLARLYELSLEDARFLFECLRTTDLEHPFQIAG